MGMVSPYSHRKHVEGIWAPRLEIDHHSFGGSKTFDRGARGADAFPADFHLPIQVIVGTVRVVMDQPKAFYPRFDGKIRGIAKGGVSPAARERVFFIRVLGVMKQQIRPTAEFHVFCPAQPALVLKTELIVGEEYEGSPSLNDLETVPTVGMIERYRAERQSAHTAIAGFEMRTIAVKVERGSKVGEVHGKIRRLHLVGQIFSDGVLGMRPAAEGEGESVRIGRLKEGKPEQVVPMGMREKEPNLRDLSGLVQQLPEIPQA
jgi:hypothetical protein